jgi:hypothetical protein
MLRFTVCDEQGVLLDTVEISRQEFARIQSGNFPVQAAEFVELFAVGK